MLSITESVFLPWALSTIARSHGFFEEAGVEVTSTLTSSSTAQRASVMDGSVDVAVTATDNLFAWNAAGAAAELDGIAVFAQIDTTAQMVLGVRPGLGSLQEAERLRLAVDAPFNGFAIAAYAMLKHLGLSRDQYDVVEVGGVRQRFEDLMATTIDVTLLGPPLDEIGAAKGMSIAVRFQEISPDYPGMGIVAGRRRLASKSDAVSAYLTGLERARSWLGSAPVADVVRELEPSGIGPAAVASMLSTVPDSFEPSLRGLELLAELRGDVDLSIAEAPAPHELVELGPLRRAGLLPSD